MRQRDLTRAVLIALVLLACAAIAMLLVTILWLSFIEGAPGDAKLGYTLANYAAIFGDPFTYRVIRNTFAFLAVTLIVSFPLGLPIAWLIERTDFPGKPVVFTLMTVALLIPGFAVALGWVFLLHPRIGLINLALMSLFELSQAPFNIGNIVWMGVVEGLSLTPLAFIMTSVVMRSMDPALEEAAAMSGAKPWQAVMRVTARVLWPGLLAAAIYVSAVCFASFDVPAILGMTQRIFTFSTYVFFSLTPTEGLPEYGNVAALGMLMVVFAMIAELVLSAGATPGAALRRHHRQGLPAAHPAARARQELGGRFRRRVLPRKSGPAAPDAGLGGRSAVPADAVGCSLGAIVLEELP